ncbi:hypothetical protein BsIDN1_64520 [Bacillus safensis]|uniref:Uncharacterized protein n=1 Tax=Bacillus safensis TaxID=561879 RepID=A0A5S9MKT3_BACIA|nr:hypothetical protein BsIDN1_64520 [Bacillus safensis]
MLTPEEFDQDWTTFEDPFQWKKYKIRPGGFFNWQRNLRLLKKKKRQQLVLKYAELRKELKRKR